MRAILSLLCAAAFAATAQPATAADGATLYKDNCARCHGDSGAADTPVAKAMKVPPVRGTSKSAEAIAKFVAESEKHKQPAGKLSPEQLEAIGVFVAAMPGG